MNVITARAPRRAGIVLSVACAFGVAGGCAGSSDVTPDGVTEQPGPASEATGRGEQPLLNGSTFGEWSACQSSGQTVVSQWAFVARTMVTSNAFAQCVRQRVGASYIPCTQDPAGAAETAIQSARSANTSHFTCFRTPGDSRLGWAGISASFNYDTELLSWGNWLDDAVTSKLNTLATHADDAANRWAPFPWPLTQGVNIIVHELLHWQGFRHWDHEGETGTCTPVSGLGGACTSNANCTAPAACNLGGPSGRCATYDMGQHSVPYIVGGCMDALIERSEQRCVGGVCSTRQADDLSSCDSRGALNVVNDFDNAGAGCSLHFDPAKRGVGAVHMENGEMRATDIVPNGKPLTSDWMLGSSDFFWAVTPADMEPASPGEEIMISSGWGVGVVGTDSNNRLKTVALAPWGSVAAHAFNGGGAWTLSSADVFQTAGRASTQAEYGATPVRDEIYVVKSGTGEWGILAPIGAAFRTRGRFVPGQQAQGSFGHWTLGANDSRYPAGDVSGDGRADFLVKSSWGIGLLSLTGANGTLAALDIRGNGGRIGEWMLSAADSIGPFGDFNADGRREFFIRSGWGVALIGIPPGESRLTTLWIKPFGHVTGGGWTLASTDGYLFPGRYTFLDRDSLLVRGASATGIIHFSGTPLTASVAAGQKVNHGARFATGNGGSWAHGASDTIQYWARADVDGDGLHEFLITSGWGIGVIGRTWASSELTTKASRQRDCGNDAADHTCHAALWGGWLNRETDFVMASMKASSGGALVLIRSATSD